MFSRRTPSVFTPNALAARLAEARRAGARLIDLTETNPARTGLAPEYDEIAPALANAELARYEPDPRGGARAREAVARYYAGIGQAVAPERIVLTASTSEAYAHLFRLLADAGDEFLAPAPSYPLFEPLAALEETRLVSYPLRYETRWRIDTDAVGKLVNASTRGIIVVSPNNPTGSMTSEAEASELESIACKHDVPILCDEVFGDFAAEPDESSRRRTFVDVRGALAFVLSGLSKVAGLPQIKLGWIVVAGPEAQAREAVERLEWIADAFLSVGAPAQVALPHLLANRHAFQTRTRERVATNRARLGLALAARADIELLRSDGGWAAVMRVPRTRSEEAWCLELLDRGVLVHPGHYYDFHDEAYLVVSLLPEPSAFARAVDEIAAIDA
ncbi:MAG: pyridoxal phosphate-dependent aminotransferase [bacterium]